MEEVYNGRFKPEFSFSMLKENIALVRDYVFETRIKKAKLAEKYNLHLHLTLICNQHYRFIYRY